MAGALAAILCHEVTLEMETTGSSGNTAAWVLRDIFGFTVPACLPPKSKPVICLNYCGRLTAQCQRLTLHCVLCLRRVVVGILLLKGRAHFPVS